MAKKKYSIQPPQESADDAQERFWYRAQHVHDLEDREEGKKRPDREVIEAYNRATGATGAGNSRERWEEVTRTWEQIEEAEDGSLSKAIEGIEEANKRKRILRDTTPVQRGIIRHLILLIDMSNSMLETDLKPNRLRLTLNTVGFFIKQFFSQNPISQLALLITRDGLAQRLTDLSGSESTHLAALDKLRPKPNPAGKSGYVAEIEPKGTPSLQNSLDLAGAMLSAAPSHGTKECLVIYGALQTADPGNIHDTIKQLVTDRVRVSVVSLSARLAVCTELVARTHDLPSSPSPQASSDQLYGVALDEAHFGTLLMLHTTPPPVTASEQAAKTPSMIPMGFPSRIEATEPSLCVCHAQPSRIGYLCTRCGVKLCSLPMQCPTCGLQCVQSTHLARSFHHLFPLKNFREVDWEEVKKTRTKECTGCKRDFPAPPTEKEKVEEAQQKKPAEKKKGVSESGRYACTVCGSRFCVECDVFAHETLHNCAGCLTKGPLAK